MPNDNRLPILEDDFFKAAETKEDGRPDAGRSRDIEYVDVVGHVMLDGTSYRFSCGTAKWNRLKIGTDVVSARNLSYHFSNIQWKAGFGWPVYSTRCPRLDSGDSGFSFPGLPRHELLILVGGKVWSNIDSGTNNSGACIGTEITDVFVGVNDDKYDDNVGGFDFILSGRSL